LQILDAAEQSSAGAQAREGWIGCGAGRLAEASPTGERHGVGGVVGGAV
jgi:hypothetical protein